MYQHQAGRSRWWQEHKQLLFFVGIVAVVIVFLIMFTFAIRTFGSDWTGFTSTTGPTLKPNEQYRPAKTLWDVLQLLIVPIILAIGGFWLNQMQKEREHRTTEERAEREKREAEQRAKTEREAAEKRAQTEREIMADNQREAALQAYLDRISELVLQTNLSDEKPDQKVLTLIRARTLTTLKRLDPDRKTSLFGFLWEAGLIGKFNLDEADLKGADLHGYTLSEAKLSKANLSAVNLQGATLFNAILIDANLTGANLGGAMMHDADLRKADLTGANLTGAYLTRANLKEAVYSEDQLNEAAKLEGLIK